MESRRVCVRGLISKDGKLFAQKLKNKDGMPADYWCTPGGGVDPMESLHDALYREMIEETGIAPEIGRLVMVQQFATKDTTSHEVGEQLEFFFEITNVDDFDTIDLACTSHGDAEVAECGFINPVTKNILPTYIRTPEFSLSLANPQTPVAFHTEL